MTTDEIMDLLYKDFSKNDLNNYSSQIIYDEVNSTPNLIIFKTANEFVAKFIKTKYSEKIIGRFETLTGTRPEIKFYGSNKYLSTENSNNKKIKKDIDVIKSTALDSSFNFENFVVGDSNQYAYTLAKTIAQNPGEAYNPLFIYGSTGLGKTHLLRAIGNYCFLHEKSVICLTSEEFFNDFALNVTNKTMQKFKDKYRVCDVLLIDDVQFFNKSEKIQEEFFYTFNALHEKKSQIVLTSDRPPKMLNGFDDRLISRFESGVMADITPPELDTKIRIIKAKCNFNGFNFNDEIINYIAINMGDNIREIEGALLDINAYAITVLKSNSVDLEFAKQVVKDRIKDRKENINIEDIVKSVSKELNIKINDIKSKSKISKIVEARRLCIYLSKELTTNSMPKLANYFCLKDHSAVSHNIKKIKELINSDEYFRIKVEELKNKIKG